MEKRKIKNQSAHFMLIGDELYKKSLPDASSLCVYLTKEEGEAIA